MSEVAINLAERLRDAIQAADLEMSVRLDDDVVTPTVELAAEDDRVAVCVVAELPLQERNIRAGWDQAIELVVEVAAHCSHTDRLRKVQLFTLANEIVKVCRDFEPDLWSVEEVAPPQFDRSRLMDGVFSAIWSVILTGGGEA